MHVYCAGVKHIPALKAGKPAGSQATVAANTPAPEARKGLTEVGVLSSKGVTNTHARLSMRMSSAA